VKTAKVAFDADYYRRFYEDPKTRIYSRARHAHLIEGVLGLISWFGYPVQSVLDVGAGVGWWGEWLKKHRRDLRYLGTELEPAICEQYGHVQADISAWRLEQQFDLVICHGVLPYLDDAAAKRAVANLAAMCRGFLYFEAITRRDVAGSVDLELTDTRVFRRTAAYYRKLLAPHFRQVGGGLWARRDSAVVFYELEVPVDRPPRRARR
jgi:2-polyprenyl-3-methyl-5-hydroxy-6-metoxy-1,4-benzoquinol methylase